MSDSTIREELAMQPIGLDKLEHVWLNLPTPTLYEHALQNKEGHLTHTGALLVRNDHVSAQAAQHKYIVDDPLIDHSGRHGEFQHSLSELQFEALFNRIRAYLAGRALYVEDCLIAAQSEHEQPLRLITQDAWHALFAKTMFAQPNHNPAQVDSQTDAQKPPFHIIHAPHFHADPSRDGTIGQSFVVMHFGLRIALIGGTALAGEIKNTVFSMMIQRLAESDVLPLHAAVHVAEDSKPALLLGPEGSGKTTLVSDPDRPLLGDDAHGWSGKHIFNFEAGCYASVDNLDQENEPLIHNLCHRFGSILENVNLDIERRHAQFHQLNDNNHSRAAYPISDIADAAFPAMLNSPKHLVLLACDAFGVLPAISRLSAEQVMYYFLLGYASQPNTDASLEPVSTFSPCCGLPFMTQHPSMYAKILAAKIRQGSMQCWLLNTGWSGGPAGIGERMSIGLTRTLLKAASNGNLNELEYQTHPVLGLQMPEQLDPMTTWHNQDDPNDYLIAAKSLAKKFNKAFAPFAEHMPAKVLKAGPRQTP